MSGDASERLLLEATLEKVRALELDDKFRDTPVPAESEVHQSADAKLNPAKPPD